MKLVYSTPIFYPNGLPHIGHISTWIYADMMCRYKIKQGEKEVYLITGLDSHGTKVREASENKKIDTEDYIYEMKRIWEKMFYTCVGKGQVVYLFNTTLSKHHELNVINKWNQLREYISKDKYSGSYDVDNEEFVPDDSNSFNMEYFINLDKNKISELLNSYDGEIPRLNMYNNVLKNIPDKLCLSRDEKWGIKVPGDEDKSIYVWFDALWFYNSMVELYLGNWNDVDVTHIIGEDIGKFHLLYLNFFYFLTNLKLPKYKITGLYIDSERKIGKRHGDRYYDMAVDALRYWVYDTNIYENKQYQPDIVKKYSNIYSNIICNSLSRLIGIATPKKTNKYKIYISHLFNINTPLNTFINCNTFIQKYRLWKHKELASTLLYYLILYVYKYEWIFVNLSEILREMSKKNRWSTKIYDQMRSLSDGDYLE